MPSQQSCWEIYNREMSQLNHGHALWEPAPLSYYERIQPGDVGYIRTGCFHLLFSAGCPLGERQLGVDVPSTFKQLDVGPIINRQPRAPGYLFTNNVRASRVRLKPPSSPPSTSTLLTSAPSPSAPPPSAPLSSALSSSAPAPSIFTPPTYTSSTSTSSTSTPPVSTLLTPPPSIPPFPMLESGSTISFRLAGGQGAALLTKYRTYREDIQRTGTFEKYAKDHHASWVTFARETGHGNDINPVLVTGVDRSRDFAMMSYSSDDEDLRSEFTTAISRVGSASAWGTWHTTGFIFTNCGPQLCCPPSTTQPVELALAGDNKTEIGSDWFNQCVFVRYHTVRKRLGIPKVIKAGAGPHDLDPGDRKDGESPKSEARSPSDSDSDPTPSLYDEEERSSATSVGSESDTIIHNTTPDGEDDFDTIADYVFRNSDADFVLLHHRDIALLREGSANLSTQLLEKLPPITVDENGVGIIWGLTEPSANRQFGITPCAPLFIPGEAKREGTNLFPSSHLRVRSLPSLHSLTIPSAGDEVPSLKSPYPTRPSATRKSASLPSLLPSQILRQVITPNSPSRSVSPTPLAHEDYTHNENLNLSTGSLSSSSIPADPSDAERSDLNASPERRGVSPQPRQNLDEEPSELPGHTTAEAISGPFNVARDPDPRRNSISTSSETSISLDSQSRKFKPFQPTPEQSTRVAIKTGNNRSGPSVFAEGPKSKSKMFPKTTFKTRARHYVSTSEGGRAYQNKEKLRPTSYIPPNLRLASLASPVLHLHPQIISDKPSTSNVGALVSPRSKPSKLQPLPGSGSSVLTPHKSSQESTKGSGDAPEPKFALAKIPGSMPQRGSMDFEVPEPSPPLVRQYESILGSGITSHVPVPSYSFTRGRSEYDHTTPDPGEEVKRPSPDSPNFRRPLVEATPSALSPFQQLPPTPRVRRRPIALSSLRKPLPLPPARINPDHRDLLRQATSILCKEFSTPPRTIEQEEVDLRLSALARMERVWKKSCSTNAYEVSDTSGSAIVGPELFGIDDANHLGEGRERRLFSEALKDGYVLCQLMNKVHPGSVFRVDKRRDGVVRASNITKFLAACSSKLGLPSEDLFFIDDLNEGSPESLARVSRTIIALVEPSENPPLDPRSFKTREPYRQLRSRGDVPPPPPRSPHRSRLSYDRNHEIPPFPSGMGSSSQVDLSDASSILSDTTTFSSLLDTGRSFARNLRSAKGGGSSIITTATTATSYSSHSHREATPSIPSPNFEYPRGKKRSRSDSRSPGSLGSGLGETAGVDLNRVAEETEGGGSGTVDKFGLRGNSSSKDRTGRSQYLGNGKWPDDFFSPSSLSSGSGLSKSLRPIIPSENTPARKLVPRHRNLLENGTLRLTLTVGEEGKPVTRFQLGNCIGRGQFGAVYQALNLNTGQMVAVKRMSLAWLKEEDILQLMREIDLAKGLLHPNIVRYQGMTRDKNTLSIVLEYAENGSLGQTLKAFGKLNERLVAGYVCKILEGLDYLHQNNVVHCDLKAANILTTKTGNVKLSDFGVSLSLRVVELDAKDVVGTPYWMAPEVIELKGVSTKSDIWSLGCTVVELCTGRPPYADIADPMSVMFRITVDTDPPIPETVSPLLDDFLRKCFQRDPIRRPDAKTLSDHEWLKNSWTHKELRPQDSIPFLRRVSEEHNKRETRYPLFSNDSTESQTRIHEKTSGVVTGEPPGIQSSPPTPAHPTSQDKGNTPIKEHSFIKTTFTKPVICRVCNLPLRRSGALCGECSLIAHSKCAQNAPPTCDLRAQLLLYVQNAGNSSRLEAPGPGLLRQSNEGVSTPGPGFGFDQPSAPNPEPPFIHIPRDPNADTAFRRSPLFLEPATQSTSAVNPVPIPRERRTSFLSQIPLKRKGKEVVKMFSSNKASLGPSNTPSQDGQDGSTNNTRRTAGGGSENVVPGNNEARLSMVTRYSAISVGSNQGQERVSVTDNPGGHISSSTTLKKRARRNSEACLVQ